jgi:hypothetical protein
MQQAKKRVLSKTKSDKDGKGSGSFVTVSNNWLLGRNTRRIKAVTFVQKQT